MRTTELVDVEVVWNLPTCEGAVVAFTPWVGWFKGLVEPCLTSELLGFLPPWPPEDGCLKLPTVPTLSYATFSYLP